MKKRPVLIKIAKVNLILLLFFLLFLAINTFYFKSIINKDITESNQKDIESMENIIQSQIEDIRRMLFLFTNVNKRLNLAYSFAGSPNATDFFASLTDVGDNLKLLIYSRQDIANIHVSFMRYDYVVDKSGVSNKKTFAESVLDTGTFDIFKYSLDKSNLDKTKILEGSYFKEGYGVDNKKAVNLFLYPTSKFIMVVSVYKQYMNNLLGILTQQSKAKAFVLNGQTIYSTSDAAMSQEDSGKVQTMLQGTSATFDWQGLQYNVIRRRNASGLSYVYLKPQTTLSSQMNDVDQYAIAFLAGFLLLDLLLFLLLRNDLYRPLVKMLKGIAPLQKGSMTNEYDTLEQAIYTMKQEVLTMEGTVELQDKIIEENRINRLFLGMDSGALLSSSKFSELYNQNYVAITCVFEDENGLLDFAHMDEFESETLTCLTVSKIFSCMKEQVYILAVQTIADVDALSAVLCKIAKTGCFIAVGISAVFSSMEHIREAYDQSRKALSNSYRNASYANFARGDYSEIQLQKKLGINITIDEERHLISSMLQGDTQEVKSCIDAIFIKNWDISSGKLRELHIYMINLLMSIINEKSLSKYSNVTDYPDLVDRVTGIFNPQLLNRIILENYLSFSSMGTQVSKQNQIQIIDYIESNYKKDISLKSIAVEFGMSQTYISLYIKRTLGINFFDYVQLKRIKEAKALLQNSNQSIGDIAHLVGFENSNSFIRTFKRYEGVTPGQYKKMSRSMG